MAVMRYRKAGMGLKCVKCALVSAIISECCCTARSPFAAQHTLAPLSR